MKKPAIVLFLSYILCTSSMAVSALTVVSVRQQIREISCVLTTIIHDDGSVGYALLPGCGKLIIALKTSPVSVPMFTSPFAVPTEGEAAKLFLRQQNVFLASDPKVQPVGGYVLLTSAATRYNFRLIGESNMLHDRTFEIIFIGTDSVTLRFWPEGKQMKIYLDQTVQVQLAYDSTPDILVTLMQLNADGSVLIRVRFPPQPDLSDVTKRQSEIYGATAIALTAATILLCVYLDYWVLKRGLPPVDWWLIHEHDPLR